MALSKENPPFGLPKGFSSSAFVLATLANPREKFWGRLLEIDVRGAVVCGIPLDSFEDFVRQLRAGEAAVPVVTFFPMHRLQSLEVERSDGALPSLADRLRQQTGADPKRLFAGRPRGPRKTPLLRLPGCKAEVRP
ncbi:MAG: hypothetical protein ABSD88_06345 [Candidatus Korobacteraceae bacterium]